MPVRVDVLKKRADFLRAARARRQGTASMMVQARKRVPNEAEGIRVGFTCSKKVGNAIARNRAKRRLREVARLVLPELGRAGWDYVLIGRAEVTAERPFDSLQEDLRHALRRIHGDR
jgi:ribonuclease P protein component